MYLHYHYYVLLHCAKLIWPNIISQKLKFKLSTDKEWSSLARHFFARWSFGNDVKPFNACDFNRISWYWLRNDFVCVCYSLRSEWREVINVRASSFRSVRQVGVSCATTLHLIHSKAKSKTYLYVNAHSFSFF